MTDISTETPSPGLLRSSVIVGVGTALSRITGLVRTVVLAYALGKLVLADSYNLANTTPNIVYDLILGGILSATLVPVFVDRFEHDDDDGINAVVTVVTSLLVALTVAAIIAAPLIFKAYTWAADKDAAQLERAGVPLLRLFLPQIAFYGLTALATAILNARRRFAAPAFVPVLNNVLVCGVLLWFAHDAGSSRAFVDSVADHPSRLWLLGAGTTGGILLMTIALWPSLRSSGWRYRWRWRPRDPAVHKIASLSGWTLGYVLANQIALTIVLALAAGQGEGQATGYLYAFQFFQLPYGLFAVSLMTTITPELASAVSSNNMTGFRDQLSHGIRLMTLVILPSSIGMIVVARPLIVGLFVHGSFTTSDAFLTADVLANFALGLLGFSLYLFVLRGFYALQDTRTPFLLNLVENGINIVLAFALISGWGAQGLAFSYSIAYMVAAVIAFAALRRRVGPIGGRGIAASTGRVAVATAVMGAVAWLAVHAVGAPSGSGAIVRLLAGVVAGLVVFGAAVLLLRVDEVDAVRKRLRRA
jgi:putative peptidoglycan lipid II flippase